MKAVRRRAARDRSLGSPRLPAVEEWSRRGDPPSRRGDSPTAVAAEALRTGVLPVVRDGRQRKIPGEDETIRVGDPDDDILANEYVGEDTPGGSTPTPDQNGVDEIGRVYGLQEEDSGSLRSGDEILSRRDRHRSELTPPRTRS
jgi:Family of unknown function (DUF6335)